MLIAFSGTDGAGKSTQISMLLTHYSKSGVKAQSFWGRGGYTPGFSLAKRLLRRLGPSIIPTASDVDKKDELMGSRLIGSAWLMLACLDIFLYYGVYIRWKLMMGCVVILDRYIIDTELDFRLKFQTIFSKDSLFWRILVSLLPSPNKELLLVVPPEMSAYRSQLKKEPFPDSENVLRFRYQSYLKISREDDRFIFIDCRRAVDMIHNQIVQSVS